MKHLKMNIDHHLYSTSVGYRYSTSNVNRPAKHISLTTNYVSVVRNLIVGIRMFFLGGGREGSIWKIKI